MASNGILLIVVGSGLLALCGPKCDLLAIVCVVLLARFRGRAQALIAATTFSLVGLVAVATVHRFPQEFTTNGQFAAAIGAIWCCALLASSSRSDRTAGRSSTNPFEVHLDELSKYVWSRSVDGTIEYVSPDGYEYLGVSPQSLRGSYSFSSLANFLTGTYNNGGFTQNFGNPTVEQTNPNVGMYAQDEWKVSPAFTLNLGVRYDLEFLQTINTDKNNVSPRVGFAWSPYRDGRTVVRSSYGLFYDRVPLRPLANALLSAHNTIDYNQATLLSYTFTPHQAGAPTFPNVAAAPPAGALENFSTMQTNIQNPYSQQASLGVEQQVSAKSTLGLSYQHVRGEHLISSYNTNINLNGTRPDPTRGNIKPYSSVFDSYFDGLEVSFQQRLVPWGSARISYTWSHAIDNVSEFFFSSPINNFNFRVDRSRSDDDQRHRVVFDAVLTSSIKPANNFADHLTHGWRLGGILQYYSRLPFNIATGGNTLQQTTQRPCAAGSGYSVVPPSGASGTPVNPCTEGVAGAVIGRNAGIGFDFLSLNARLSRTFALTERVRLEGMAEAFNTLNHRNDMIPNGTFGTGSITGSPTNTTFGQATAVGDPRSVQLAARLTF
jgi:TonB dependent receptor